MRVTPTTMMNNLIANLQATQKSMDRLQQEVSTGRRVLAVSDDPTAASRILWYRSALLEMTRYKANVETAGSALETVETALNQVEAALSRAKEVAVTGANDAQPQASRDALAAEIGQIVEHLVAVGNTYDGERYIFAGNRSQTKPFQAVGSPPTAVSYLGDTGAHKLEIGPGETLQVNLVGGDVFTGPGNPVDALIALRDDLLAGRVSSISSNRIAEIDGAIDKVLGLVADVGARQNRLESTRSALDEQEHRLMVVLDREEGADIAEVTARLKIAEQNQQITLATTARLVRSTLIDYLA